MSEIIPYQHILKQIQDIQKGDIVYLVSDIIKLAMVYKKEKQDFSMELFLDSIIEKIGPEGTLLVPAFNWEFCQGKAFDIRKTVSKTGALGNAALKHPLFKRSKHPIYSFCIWGKDQEYLTSIDPKDAFGEDSIFAYLHKKKAKALVVGIPPMYGLTFCHYVEQKVGVPYRYLKNFTGQYTDYDGNSSEKTYSMYVRDLQRNPQYIKRFENLGLILQQLNISKQYEFNQIPFHVVDLEHTYLIIEMDIKLNDSGNLYSYVKIENS